MVNQAFMCRVMCELRSFMWSRSSRAICWQCLYFTRRFLLPSGFPDGSDGKESACNAGDLGLAPGSGRSPGEGNCNPLHCSCLENPHGQSSLAGLSPWGHKELDMTGRLTLWQNFNFVVKVTGSKLWNLINKPTGYVPFLQDCPGYSPSLISAHILESAHRLLQKQKLLGF